jgi:hypothetical protein
MDVVVYLVLLFLWGLVVGLSRASRCPAATR